MRKHPIKKIILSGMICATVFTLASCDSSGVPIREETQVTLPPAAVVYIAPIGDAALEYTSDATLYLPRYDGNRLISLSGTVACSAARLDEESVVRALLQNPGNGVASPMGGSVKLTLYGTNPVEVSGDVATVNLSASALQLDRKELYLCGQAIANTLTELGGIRYVNVLVMDKQIGMDLGSTLPTGALTRSMSSDVGAIYDQALSQRVGPDENPKSKRLSATVALYFPLSAVNGIMPEARNISFSSQDPADMIRRLLEELSEGTVMVSGSPTLPLLAGLLTMQPQVSEPEDGSGKVITLRFDSSMDDMLKTKGVSRASCMGAISYTLCTFLPNVTGIVAYIGDERIDHVMLGATDGILFDDGVQRRTDFAPLLMNECTLYFSNREGTALTEVHRPIPYYQRTNPRALLLELFKGPQDADSVRDANPVMPVGLMADADILGLSINDRTLLVNLSANFAKAGEGFTQQQDRILAYAMVNTLLCNDRATRVCFFVGGKAPENITGEISWSGYFYENRSFTMTR